MTSLRAAEEPAAASNAPQPAAARRCGTCSLCCRLLRVDELGKPAGTACAALRAGVGCTIHTTRPAVCRAYRCLWLQGAFEDGDRPDRLGALLDFVPEGGALRLQITEAEPGAFERSPRLREIAEVQRAHLPVRIADALDPLDPDRPFRVLLPGAEERRVAGERVQRFRAGVLVEERRLPWLERVVRRAIVRLRARRLRRLGLAGEAGRRVAPPGSA